MSRAAHGDRGQTIGVYIVAMAALFFLAFAYFAVGQAAVTRNSAQTAADAAALAAARQERDDVHDAFLAALLAGDGTAIGDLLAKVTGAGDPCGAASAYAEQNHASLGPCVPVADPPGFTVQVVTRGTVGRSVVKGSEDVHGKATATAVVEPRCHVGDTSGHTVNFSCRNGPLAVDPTAPGFVLDLSAFFSVHLSK
ncbi:pilus assembly protein TadG-related protein [Streptomyces sp. V4-01]|uniref:Pilus assembly protein TadG-related protein n=1 Tax=Actinacidiphila polyblastidii TaxID=3110430 RepID=A0ABU7PCL6_9ACTN|nr:pilus assembly protein TadG-related protein [Streptomyces sp. V4-01]